VLEGPGEERLLLEEICGDEMNHNRKNKKTRIGTAITTTRKKRSSLMIPKDSHFHTFTLSSGGKRFLLTKQQQPRSSARFEFRASGPL
jgi:hypothetical protein